MTEYNIVVVDDSAFMRKVISDLINKDKQFNVVATAKNGAEAVAKVIELRPDAVTMDLEMPVMNGLDALKLIMADQPTPVVMLSSVTAEGAAETILALEHGAVDFIRKPSGAISLNMDEVADALLDKLRVAVTVRVDPRKEAGALPPATGRQSSSVAQAAQLITPPSQTVLPSAFSQLAAAEAPPLQPARGIEPPVAATGRALKQLVAVGTSTGGPRALQQLLTSLPADLPAPLLIVQHMPPKFTKSLAQRLDTLSALHVVEAEEGMPLLNGTAYIAPGGSHMKLRRTSSGDYVVALTKEDPCSGHRPSVDMLFQSLLPFKELKRHAVIMTGMGSDGAKGMKALSDSGASSTIAEAEQSCIVFGMPRSAIELGAVTHVAPLQDIAPLLIRLLRGER